VTRIPRSWRQSHEGTDSAAHRQIVGAVRERRAEIILTPAGQVVSRLAGLAPGLTSEVLHLGQQLALPGASTAADGEGTPGQDLDPAIPRKAFDRLTALGRTAAGRFNERRLPPGPVVEATLVMRLPAARRR
jgi:hypothetical protein